MHVGIFALGDAKVPNANGFASQWNIGLRVDKGSWRVCLKTFKHNIERLFHD